MYFEEIFILCIFIFGIVAISLFCFFCPTTDSYTLVCDGIEYDCVDFSVKEHVIELYDHDHGGLFCGPKCSRNFINKPTSTFVVIEHKTSSFERIFKK